MDPSVDTTTTFNASAAETIPELREALGERLRGASSLRDASQRMVSFVFEKFVGSVVLARLFATVPMGRIPSGDRPFVESLAGAARDRLSPTTRIMSLLGTRGIERDWNDRARSKGHRGVPLIDGAFVNTIPMVARMLSELGIDLKMFQPAQIDTRRFAGGINGIFYVADAKTAIDSGGRLIIPDESFVTDYGIQTVFGMGGNYIDGQVAVAIFFCKDFVERKIAERFVLLISDFRALTAGLVEDGRMFY